MGDLTHPQPTEQNVYNLIAKIAEEEFGLGTGFRRQTTGEDFSEPPVNFLSSRARLEVINVVAEEYGIPVDNLPEELPSTNQGLANWFMKVYGLHQQALKKTADDVRGAVQFLKGRSN